MNSTTDKKKQIVVRGLTGLNNIGNTCYMNSIIQCLTALDFFRSWLLKDKYMKQLYQNIVDSIANTRRKKENKNEDEQIVIKKSDVDTECENTISYQLAALMQTMWYRNFECKPETFKKIVDKKIPMFLGYKQHDSQEFLTMVLDTIHEETKSKVKVVFPNVPDYVQSYLKVKAECTDKINDESVSIEDREKYLQYLKQFRNTHINSAAISDSYLFWRKYISNSHSIITDLFTGLYYSKVVCQECNNITWSFDPFTVMSIQIPEKEDTTLNEALKKFVSTELLNDDEKYFCTDCNKKVNATKKLNIWEPPNILVIHLKRFKVMNQRMMTKITSLINFPLNGLDIKDYSSDIHEINNTVYDLHAISSHSGSYYGGHYISYCRNGINENWYGFNDERVYHIPDDYLEKEVVSRNAYILFYVRRLNNNN